MEEKKNLFDYMASVLVVYGFTILVMNLFCLIGGDNASTLSTLFSLGSRGLSVATSVQLLALSVVIVLFRTLFFSDLIIHQMGIAARTVGLFLSIVVSIVIFVVLFKWFPINDLKCWLLFFVCFGISFFMSFLSTAMRERKENRQMEQALEKIKDRD